VSAYNRGDQSLEGYESRILAAICKQNGGEIRIKGELIDTTPVGCLLIKGWDSEKQELVIMVNMYAFPEVWRVAPASQPTKEVIAADPIRKQAEQPMTLPFNPSGSTLDNEKLADMEKTLQKRRIASMLSDELKKRRQPEA
jgi:hypothetical protein